MSSACKHCGAQNHVGRLACYACDYPLIPPTPPQLTTADGERGHEFFAIELTPRTPPLRRSHVASAALPPPAAHSSAPPNWWGRVLRSVDALLRK